MTSMVLLMGLVLRSHKSVIYFVSTAVVIFLPSGSLNRKDLFEGLNQFFVVCLHCSDNELNISSQDNQKYGV